MTRQSTATTTTAQPIDNCALDRGDQNTDFWSGPMTQLIMEAVLVRDMIWLAFWNGSPSVDIFSRKICLYGAR
jgi:hypothetical protein